MRAGLGRAFDDPEAVTGALARARRPGWEDADVFVERRARIAARFADGAVADASLASDEGACARVLERHRVVFACVDSARTDDVVRLVRELSPQATGSADSAVLERLDVPALFGLLEAIDRAARDLDGRVDQVVVEAEQEVQDVLVAGLDGATASDTRHLLYLTVRAVARDGDGLAAGFYTPGTSSGDGLEDSEAIGREAATRAIVALSAGPAPIARLPVVVGPGRGMILVHEACCHPLEGDEVLRGSIHARAVGQPIASELVTIVDDPSAPGAVGSYRVDDDGTPAGPTTLIEAGRLSAFLTDKESARALGVGSSGNGRRQSYRHSSLPRMSNTRMLAGDRDPASLLADTERGIYAQHVGGGEVVESTGDFVFRVLNGFLIQDGRLGDPIRETTVHGNGATVLRDIDGVADDVATGAAKCGKFGQLLPVGVIGPTVRIRSLLVGGTER